MLKTIDVKKHHSKNRRRKRLPSKILFYLIFLAFLGASVYILFFSGKLSIASIKVSGNQFIKNEDITSSINAEISGKYLGLMDKNNILLFRKNSVENKIQRVYPQIESIKIVRKFPGSLLVNITERKPMLALCESPCWMIDENGTAYESIDTSSDEFKNYGVISLTDQSNKSVNLGNAVLDRNYLNYISQIKKKLESDLGLETENNFETPSLISDDIRVRTTEGWMIYFSENIDLEKEIKMLGAVLGNEISDKRQNLNYIDLRIDNKVFYKLNNSQDSQQVNQDNNTVDNSTSEEKDANKKKKKK